jgi:CheY-like chemotaxis protein
MKEQVRLDGLLFSGDTELLHVMKQILGNFAIHTEIYTELGSAVEAVTHRRVDALIVDWDLANDPTRVVRSARKSSPNRNSTIVAMVDAGSETHALMVGANFMIYKPVDSGPRQPLHAGGLRHHACRNGGARPGSRLISRWSRESQGWGSWKPGSAISALAD